MLPEVHTMSPLATYILRLPSPKLILLIKNQVMIFCAWNNPNKKIITQDTVVSEM
jgi:hypothetical protein